MFTPRQYLPVDDSYSVELITENPLAVLVTSHGSRLFASHVPILTAPGKGDFKFPEIMFGHMNRQNPHWQRLVDDAICALLLFQGVNSYVSPAIYSTVPSAPTWDFTAVHVYGKLDVINDREETFRVVRETAVEFERRFGQDWDMAGSIGYFERLLPGVGAFRVTVQSIESMFKLSQEQAPDARARVIEEFTQSKSESQQRLADLMTRWVTADGPRE